MSEYIVQAKKLCKKYMIGQNEIRALSDIDLDIPEGQFLTVMGKSGSGKTTLLNMIGGLDLPDSGSVEISGQEITAMPEKKLSVFRRRNIGFVFQFFHLIPELNLRENIVMPLLLDRSGQEETYFNEICDTLEISDRLMHLPSEVSGGQQQRAAIARALIMKPKVILFDEPTGNLDETSSKTVMELVRRSSERFNQTIVMVTHDLDVASYSDVIIHLKDGEKV